MNTITENTTSKSATLQAQEDEFIMNSGEQLYCHLITVSEQFVHFEHDHVKLGFLKDEKAKMPLTVIEGHYENIGVLNERDLIIYKTAAKEVGYGLLSSKKRRCLKISIDELIAGVLKEPNPDHREMEMDFIIDSVDQLIART